MFPRRIFSSAEYCESLLHFKRSHTTVWIEKMHYLFMHIMILLAAFGITTLRRDRDGKRVYNAVNGIRG